MAKKRPAPIVDKGLKRDGTPKKTVDSLGYAASGGRPCKDVDVEKLRQFASILCTIQEMSDLLGVSTDTLEREPFCAIIKKAQSTGKQSLRRSQFKGAMEGNTSMQIWLGKQLLGQREPKVELSKDAMEDIEKLLDNNRDPLNNAK